MPVATRPTRRQQAVAGWPSARTVEGGKRLLQRSQKRQRIGWRLQEKAEAVIPQPRLFILGMNQNGSDTRNFCRLCGAQNRIAE
jgi:hypothetical protein